MSIWNQVVGSVLKPITDIISEKVEDTDKANELTASIQLALLSMDAGTVKAQESIITAEAKGDSWLQRNWRPLTMLSFTGLIAAHWLGFTPPNLSEPQVLGLLDIVKIGLGGYVVGRSAEKIATEIAPALGRR